MGDVSEGSVYCQQPRLGSLCPSKSVENRPVEVIFIIVFPVAPLPAEQQSGVVAVIHTTQRIFFFFLKKIKSYTWSRITGDLAVAVGSTL